MPKPKALAFFMIQSIRYNIALRNSELQITNNSIEAKTLQGLNCIPPCNGVTFYKNKKYYITHFFIQMKFIGVS
jgi:hypothetical protein